MVANIHGPKEASSSTDTAFLGPPSSVGAGWKIFPARVHSLSSLIGQRSPWWPYFRAQNISDVGLRIQVVVYAPSKSEVS